MHSNLTKGLYFKMSPFLEQPVISDERIKSPMKNDEAKQTFLKLLNTIVKVNEQRLVTVKKMADLQDYMLTKNKLKTDYDSYDSIEDEDSRILIAYAQNFPRLRRAEDEAITRAMCNNMNLFRHNTGRATKFFRNTCRERAIRQCIAACKQTLADVNSKSNCILKTRRDSISTCKDNCRNSFDYDLD
ncbi:uncharacterized protein LOC124643082 [Helicoverpa zea]|uniref:uncharacterized protein LOC124643082 n=1 Tax=Helicoverpa zea TaxID=7113 RepID=UPI001F58DB56|nr:uncharacterized protein LOC124643082 [Helicoverpa zea]